MDSTTIKVIPICQMFFMMSVGIKKDFYACRKIRLPAIAGNLQSKHKRSMFLQAKNPPFDRCVEPHTMRKQDRTKGWKKEIFINEMMKINILIYKPGITTIFTYSKIVSINYAARVSKVSTTN